MSKETSDKKKTSRGRKKKEVIEEEENPPNEDELTNKNQTENKFITFDKSDPIQSSLVNIILDPDTDETTKIQARKLLDQISMNRNPLEFALGKFIGTLTPLLIYIPFLVGLAIIVSIFNPEAGDALGSVFSFLSSVVWVAFLIFLVNKIFQAYSSNLKK